MSSIKKILCVKAKNEGTKLFTTGAIYDVINDSGIGGGAAWVNDNLGRKTFIILDSPCVHGEWQPLEEYVCINATLIQAVKLGCVLFGYEANGLLKIPIDNLVLASWRNYFKKTSEMKAELKPRHEVRHVIYDTKDNKIANDAMGECYITLAEAQEVCDEMNAPKVMKSKYTKEVEYFGMKLLVREDVKFIATSRVGVILTTSGSFTLSESCQTWVSSSGTLDSIHKVDLNGIDWKDTLVEIK